MLARAGLGQHLKAAATSERHWLGKCMRIEPKRGVGSFPSYNERAEAMRCETLESPRLRRTGFQPTLKASFMNESASSELPLSTDNEPYSRGARIGTIFAVVLPLAGFAFAMVSLWGWGFGWVDFGLLVGMYALSAVGITVGFHRYFTHTSFETNAVVRFMLAPIGSSGNSA